MLIAAIPYTQERSSLIAIISNFGTFRFCDVFLPIAVWLLLRTLHLLHVLG